MVRESTTYRSDHLEIRPIGLDNPNDDPLYLL